LTAARLGAKSAIAGSSFAVDRCYDFGSARDAGRFADFNNARRYVAPLLIIGLIFAAIGLA